MVCVSQAGISWAYVIKHIDFVNFVEEVSQENFRFYHFSSRRRREVNKIADALDDDAAHCVYFAATKTNVMDSLPFKGP